MGHDTVGNRKTPILLIISISRSNRDTIYSMCAIALKFFVIL